MMGQIPEGQQSEALKIPLGGGEEKFEKGTALATICVYGYGPTKSPFYEEAQTVRANSEGGVLILGAPVSCGQKLLLINGRGSNPVEAQIVNTRTLGAQMFEVEVAFPFPQPEFWRPLRGGAKKKDLEKRRFPRVTLPSGMSIAWKVNERHNIARVKSISLGGLFIEEAEPVRVGDTVQVHFDIPGGAIHAKAVVRRSIKGQGMGVEFTELPAEARAALHKLLQKLLGDVRTKQ
jgi:PilZ domain